MANEIRVLGKQSSVYAVGTLLSRGLGFFLIPLYTHYLSPKEYGILEMLDLTGTIISFFVAMGISNSILRFYGHYQEENEKEDMVNTGLIFALVAGGCLVAMLVACSDVFSNIIFGSNEYSLYFKFVFINIYIAQLNSHCMTIYRVRNQAKTFTIFSIISTLSAIGLNIYFLAIMSLGIISLYYSSIITFSLITSLILIKQFIRKKIVFSSDKLRRMLKYGLYFIPTLLITFVVNFSDRYFLKAYTDLQTVGVYALGYKIGMIVFFLIGFPFQQAWGAYAFQIVHKENASRLYSRIFTYYVAVLLFVALSVAVLSREMVAVMANPAFFDAYMVIPIVALAIVFFCADNVTRIGILIKEKTAYLPAINFAIAAINVLFNFLLIPRYGMMGAAFSTLISFVFLPLGSFLVSQRMYPIRYESVRLIKAVSMALMLYGVSMVLPKAGILQSILMKSLVILCFPALLYVMPFLDAEEKGHISKALTWSRQRLIIARDR